MLLRGPPATFPASAAHAAGAHCADHPAAEGGHTAQARSVALSPQWQLVPEIEAAQGRERAQWGPMVHLKPSD